jgi:hypothetical protein
MYSTWTFYQRVSFVLHLRTGSAPLHVSGEFYNMMCFEVYDT